MNVLIIGTGVIGSIYGWQLSEAGYSITHFVREGKKTEVETHGINIRCLDARKQDGRLIETVYKPNVVDKIGKDEYALIIVPVKVNQLNSVLPLLAQTGEHANILFLQNLWVTHIVQIESALPNAQIIYGQAHITGGGKLGNAITCVIFGSKNAPTMLGRRDGVVSEQVKQIANMMKQADMNPKIIKNIREWLFSHYAEANGLISGVMEAGSAQNYVQERKYIKDSIRLIREGFKVCALLHMHPWRVYPQMLYYAPVRCLLPALLKMYRTKESQMMLQGHIAHSPDEMRAMFQDILETGIQLGLPMTRYKRMSKYLEGY